MSPSPMCGGCTHYDRVRGTNSVTWGRCRDVTKQIFRADGSPSLAPLVFHNHWCHAFQAREFGVADFRAVSLEVDAMIDAGATVADLDRYLRRDAPAAGSTAKDVPSAPILSQTAGQKERSNVVIFGGKSRPRADKP